LNNYLIARYQKNTTTVLIVDEAQHLELELLEEIRLLTNLETPQQKLLQIVLVGQPELDLKVDSPDLRQLKQRIALRCQLEPLQEEETQGYILQRLQRAGANSHATTMFPKETIASVYRYSKGIPRLINTVCENALIAAYAAEAQAVRPEVVDEVAKDLRLNVLSRAPSTMSTATNKRGAIPRLLLEWVEALERVVRDTQARETSSDQGAKIA
jgi:general secretion pathway protein A